MKSKENAIMLQEVINEAKRFINKAELAMVVLKGAQIAEEKNEYVASAFKEVASAKRSALDLKRELTRITQMTQYY